MNENRLARLTDLSRAFDCLLHDHLLAKLHPYGFRLSALKLIHSYLKTENEELQSIQHIVLGMKYFCGYHKDLS